MLQLCDAGYRRVDNVLYGGECRLCDCNRHAASCDPFTGVCEVRTSSFKLFQKFGLKHQLYEIKYTSYFLSSINKIYVTVELHSPLTNSSGSSIRVGELSSS